MSTGVFPLNRLSLHGRHFSSLNGSIHIFEHIPHSVLEYTPNQKISDIASMLGVLFHEPTDTKLFVVEGVD